MKKIITALLTLVMLVSLSVTAFADLGPAQFDDWYVVCGMGGYDFEDFNMATGNTFKSRVEPGIKLMVYSYNNVEKEYLLVIKDGNFDAKGGKGMFTVPEADLKSKFYEANKAVGKETGTKLEKEVKGKVSSDVGVVLRQGPATTFKSYTTIPQNADVSYEYTYKYGGHNWGYVTYKGQNGWVCIDYVKGTGSSDKKDGAVASTPDSKNGNSASNNSNASGNNATGVNNNVDGNTPNYGSDSNGSMNPDSAYNGNESQGSFGNADGMSLSPENSKAPSFFSSTANVIIFCVMCAVILVLMAIIIMMLVQRKKEQKKIDAYNNAMRNNNNNNYNNNYYQQ